MALSLSRYVSTETGKTTYRVSYSTGAPFAWAKVSTYLAETGVPGTYEGLTVATWKYSQNVSCSTRISIRMTVIDSRTLLVAYGNFKAPRSGSSNEICLRFPGTWGRREKRTSSEARRYV